MPISFDIEELYHHKGLLKLHKKFCSFLVVRDQQLYNKWQNISSINSELILELSPHIEVFIARLFDIEEQVNKLHQYNKSFDNVHKCKRQFIQRYALKKYRKIEDFSEIKQALAEILQVNEITEVLYADRVMFWWQDQDKYQQELEYAAKYAVWMIENSTDSVLFNLPKKLDYNALVDTKTYSSGDYQVLKSPTDKKRHGFQLTDPGLNTISANDQVNYCIFCHKQAKDSCRQGFCNKDNTYKISPTNTKLTGCPLDEKISEMNFLKSQGYNIAALAVITLDNPMCAATGHRICNDCMRSCIYQKQSPVNIPGVETNILTEVLTLPYGFEVYSLLTRWNPLNLINPLPKEDSNYKVLVVGLGPAGFTMAHYLLNEGHTVVAIDGLKIEPLPAELTGVNKNGKIEKFKAIVNINELYEELDKRVIYGFGGVTEYGITVRWNKNYLKIIRLLLERRKNLVIYGGVRFGSNITYNDTMNLGFHHIALAIGSGSPNLINIKNNLTNGVRMASDFLMSLQLSGAFKMQSIANLQVRLPIVVIGGGLTAFDAATEALHYYPIEVEKFAQRYYQLKKTKEDFHSNWTTEEKEIAEEFLYHAKLLQSSNNKLQTLKDLGGVKILYRKNLQESPAYRLNHEEVEQAMAEGIELVENFIPTIVINDQYNNAQSIKGYIHDQEKVILAKTILIAAGTKANTILSKEDPINFKDFINNPKDNTTILGDINPLYSGSVVKAIASAKDSYQAINNKLRQLDIGISSQQFLQKIDDLLRAEVIKVLEISPNIYEVIIKSPFAAKNFSPGQFYRLQNYESTAPIIADHHMLMEGVALTGASTDQDYISTIVLDVGASSHLCKHLCPGESVILMGPTGSPTEIPHNETVMLVGGGLGDAVLFSIGQTMRKNNCKVLYFAGYKKKQDRYKINEIEKAADIIVWACDETRLTKTRTQDFSYQGNIITAIEIYNQEGDIKLNDIDRMVVIGSDTMMNAVKTACNNQFKKYLKPDIKIIASINSPMQCMMKEICAQCLQKHIDPITGQETFVYSCFNQDQDMKYVDFFHLKQRLKQNSLQEKLVSSWLEIYSFSK